MHLDNTYNITIKESIQSLKAKTHRYGIVGLIISFLFAITTSIIAAHQLSGYVSIDTIYYAHEQNFALRVLFLLPLIFLYWIQHTHTLMARHAGSLIRERTQDLKEEKTAWKNKSHHTMTHDSLTGLPNRAMFYEKLESAFIHSQKSGNEISIIIMDMDRFNYINEQYGHRLGDLVLKEVTMRLDKLVDSTGVLARMSGDEFAVLITSIETEHIAIRLAKSILEALSIPVVIDDIRVDVHVTVGISNYPNQDQDESLLIQQASIALRHARTHSEELAIYTPEHNKTRNQTNFLVSDLKSAIENDELFLTYQPKINLHKNTIYGVETLVRWRHPEHGIISPAEFILLAERNRLIKPLTTWILVRALKDAADWVNNGIHLNIAINISVKDLVDPELPALLHELLGTIQVPAHIFTLEITESSIMEDPDSALETIRQLREMGFMLSIDDFGTGYSSLSYLSKLPVNELKIDRSFIMGMLNESHDAIIVKTTIELAHNLGLKVTAEGIEDEKSYLKLCDLGCDTAQGFYMSPPLEKDELLEWCQDSRWGLASEEWL